MRCPVTFLLSNIASPETNRIIEAGSGTFVGGGPPLGSASGVGVGDELGDELGVGPDVGLMKGVISGGTKATIGGGLSPCGTRNGIAAAPINRNQNFGLRDSSNGYTATSRVVITSGGSGGISFSGWRGRRYGKPSNTSDLVVNISGGLTGCAFGVTTTLVA